MDRRLLAPRWLALHLGVVVALVGCGLLGYWQLDRARDQYAQSLRPAANLEVAPEPLDAVLRPGEQLDAADIGRPVTTTGRYDESNGLLVPDRELGDENGYLVVTPLRTDAGTALMVVRGWLPTPPDGGDPVAPAPPSGDVTVTGWLGAAEGPPPLASSLPDGQIASVHLPSLVNIVPYELYDAVVTNSSPQSSAQTQLRQLPPPVSESGGDWPLQNVFYAVEWWVFGLAAVALWVSAVRRMLGADAVDAVGAQAEHAARP